MSATAVLEIPSKTLSMSQESLLAKTIRHDIQTPISAMRLYLSRNKDAPDRRLIELTLEKLSELSAGLSDCMCRECQGKGPLTER